MDYGKSILYTEQQNKGLTACFLRQCCIDGLCPTWWPQCCKCGLALAMPLCSKAMIGLIANHYCKQNEVPRGFFFCGNGALGVCALHCDHHAPKHILTLAMQPSCTSHDWTVANHYCTQNEGLAICFFANGALTVCAPHCGHHAPKLARFWPCSSCAQVMIEPWYHY